MDDLSRLELEFNWDEGNKYKNWIKHKIKFKESEEVFFDENVFVSVDVKHSTLEERYQALGKTKKNKYLVIYFTVRKNKIRVISVRHMSRKERKQYEKI